MGLAAPLSWTIVTPDMRLGMSRSEIVETVVPQAMPHHHLVFYDVADEVPRHACHSFEPPDFRSGSRHLHHGDVDVVEVLDAAGEGVAGLFGCVEGRWRTSPRSRAEAIRRETVDRDMPSLLAIASMVCCSTKYRTAAS